MAVADFVLDNSVAMRWVLPNSGRPEAHRYADDVLDRLVAGATALVPDLWQVEAASVLLKAEKKAQISAADTERLVSFFDALRIETQRQSNISAVIAVARTHGLSGYDAVYLELAIHSGLPLATADEGLGKAARTAGVPLYLGGAGI
ncbi:MAG: type II toxin-antitoxin system VapC family toxin [Nevskiaceae bacterium]|jgi:predicted nucleic acid-binding protein|nr:type II toxin-antitoxin system VapC family toxin [Nevskiaceae bacterium]